MTEIAVDSEIASRGTVIRTDLPGRMDRLPWSNWHWRIVIALGVTWILDGLEVTIVGSLASALKDPRALSFTDSQVGLAASAYLAGGVIGALVFGRLTDSLGRKRLFLVSLAVYLVSTILTAASWNFLSFAFFRALTGAGIGGEYAAINSTIDELIPARVRGRVDLAINSTFWVGTAMGAASTLILLDPAYIPCSMGWRLCFLLGALLGFAILLIRRHVPESPRWLLLHGRVAEARKIVEEIEATIEGETGKALTPAPDPVHLKVKGSIGFMAVAELLVKNHRRRTTMAR